ncbi:AAA family ATPase [Endozoicomonas sp. ALD040]|uniref:AAA family ATPase n=1 Tax=Endozoicomonas sp. ALD040 TaxID=3403079 RepID=UPI003BB05746
MTIVEQIAKWVNEGKPGWWRYAIRVALDNQIISNQGFEEIYQTAKMEYDFVEKSPDYDDRVSTVKPVGFEEEERAYTLESISQVNNVCSLSSDQTMRLPRDGIIVIYGENGAGKSSYAKILKNACLTRGDAPEILPNIFEPSNGVPSAVITLDSDGAQETHRWVKDSIHQPALKSIRVFDSSSSAHYLSKDGVIEYKPAALSLLDELYKAAEYVKTRANTEKMQAQSNLILPQMHEGTKPSTFRITDKTTLEQVEALCATADELKSLEPLEKEYHELVNNSPEALKQNYQARKRHLEPLLKFLMTLREGLGDKAVEELKGLFQRVKDTKQLSSAMAKEAFSDLYHGEIGSSQWLIMWKAVEKFVASSHPDLGFPPREGDTCPTCLQTVGEESAERLAGFQKYLSSEIHQQSEDALGKRDAALKAVRGLDVNHQPYLPILEEIADRIPEAGERFEALLAALKGRRDDLLREPGFTYEPLDMRPIEWLQGQIQSLTKKEAELNRDEGRERLIAEKLRSIQEIKDRKAIMEFKTGILGEIDKAKLRGKFDTLLTSCRATSITRKNSEISSSGTIGRIGEFFEEELGKLGFNNLPVLAATKGSKGNQLLSLKLSGNNGKLPDIASEGEQKCISLAGFFSDLRVDNRKSAVIFDDPVNSLDHKWRLKFAERITEESKHRQVVVLTHDLTFVMMLKDVADEIHEIGITRGGRKSGKIMSELPWNAMGTAQRIDSLDRRIPTLRTVYEDSEEAYKYHVKSLYGDMRKTLERLIEEVLIKKMVTRFSTDIKPGNARYLLDTKPEDIEAINWVQDLCSQYCHDNAVESGVTFPPPDEVKQDIEKFRAFFKDLKSRRK